MINLIRWKQSPLNLFVLVEHQVSSPYFLTKKIIDNTLARQSLWKNEMKANTLQRLIMFWVRRFSLHNSVRTWSPMNHLAEPGLKGARAEARASWFYFIPPQRIDGAALAAPYLLLVMDPQKIYSLTNSLRLVNRGKRSICPCSYPS